MIRKILLSAVFAATMITGVSCAASQASAQTYSHGRHHSYHPSPRHHVHFEVLVRHRNHWDSYGTYHSRYAAERAAERLRWQGYIVRIEREVVRY